MLRNYQYIMIVIFVTSPVLVLPEPTPSMPSHISKIASTHPVEETIYNVKREKERERGRDGLRCHCSVGVCFDGFHDTRTGFVGMLSLNEGCGKAEGGVMWVLSFMSWLCLHTAVRQYITHCQTLVFLCGNT